MGENFNLQTPWSQQPQYPGTESVDEIKKEPYVEPPALSEPTGSSKGGGRAPVYHTVGHSIFHHNPGTGGGEDKVTEEEYQAALGISQLQTLATKSAPVLVGPGATAAAAAKTNRKFWNKVETVGVADLSTKTVEMRNSSRNVGWTRIKAVEDLVVKNEGIWQCKHCGKTGKTSGQVRMHAERHIEGLVFECQICDKSFRSRGSLACHKLSTKHKLNKSQQEMGKGLMTIPSHIEHKDAVEQMVEKQGDIWQCKYCGKTKKLRSQIRIHAESHIEGLLFECQLCGKSFESRGSLYCHKSNKHRNQASNLQVPNANPSPKPRPESPVGLAGSEMMAKEASFPSIPNLPMPPPHLLNFLKHYESPLQHPTEPPPP